MLFTRYIPPTLPLIYSEIVHSKEDFWCARLTNCGPTECVCDRSQGYAKDTVSGKCVKREHCRKSEKEVPLTCGIGEIIENCPGSCNEPKCGDGVYDLSFFSQLFTFILYWWTLWEQLRNCCCIPREEFWCAEVINCSPAECICNRGQGYAKDTVSAKCVKREQCREYTWSKLSLFE